MSTCDSRSVSVLTNDASPSAVDKSAGMEMHSPCSDSSAAAASHASALRAVM
jgi:hypothetical protein